MKKRLLSLVLAVLLICSLLPVAVLADTTYGDYTIITNTQEAVTAVLSSVAEVTKADGVITIKLTADVNGRIQFGNNDGTDDTGDYVLDLNGHTIDAGATNEAVCADNDFKGTVTITGSGTLKKGNHHIVYVGNINTVKFALQSGYDYFTIKVDGTDKFGTEKLTETKTADHIDGTSLVLTQCENSLSADVKWGDSAGSLTGSGSIADALAAAPAYIQLQQDVTLSDTAIGNTMTVDLNGFTLAVPAGKTATVAAGKVLTVINTMSTGGLDISGDVNVLGSLDISSLTYNEGGLLAGKTGSLDIGKSGIVKLMSIWASFTPNWMDYNNPAFFGDVEDGATVVVGENTYKYISDAKAWLKNGDTAVANSGEYFESYATLDAAMASAAAGTSVYLIDNLSVASLELDKSVVVLGKLTVTGNVLLKSADVTLTAPVGLNVTTDVSGSKVVYASGAYRVVPTSVKAKVESNKNGDVFLGGNYIEVGISKHGSFGTSSAPKDTSFHPYSPISGIGLRIDGDGWDADKAPTTGDFFLPGTEEERWILAYYIGGTKYEFPIADRVGNYNSTSWSVEPRVYDASDVESGLLKAVVKGTTKHGVDIEITYFFGVGDKMFITDVIITNNGTDDITNARFVRSFDPDMDAEIAGGTYSTYNKVICNPKAGDALTEGSDKNYAMVVARGAKTLEGFFFVAFDERARASIRTDYGLAPGSAYEEYLWDEAKVTTDTKATAEALNMTTGNANGYSCADVAIALTFDLGTIAKTKSTTLQYHSSLDPKVENALAGLLKSFIDYENEKLTGLEANTAYVVTVINNGTAGETYSLTSDAAGTIALSGNDNSNPAKAYDFIGKTIKIAKADNSSTSDDISVSARPDNTVTPTYNPGDTNPELPDSLEITTTANSITIKAKPGQQYRIGSNSWVTADSSGLVTFSGLTKGTEYTIETRIAATGISFASGSKEFKVATKNMFTLADVTVSGSPVYYDATDKVLTITADGATVKYAAALTGEYKAECPKNKDLGTYTIYYKVSKDGYHDYYNTAELKIIPAALTGTVKIVGSPYVGSTVKAEVTNTNNHGTFSYQWYRVGDTTTLIPGATSSTYKLTKEDLNCKMACVVTSSIETGSINGTSAVKVTNMPYINLCSNICTVCGGCSDPDCDVIGCTKKCTMNIIPFTDVKAGQWYTEAIGYVYHHGLMDGVGGNKFDVKGALSRAMIVQILYNAEGRPVVSSASVFSDVKNGAWYSDAIAWANMKGIIEGYNGKFDPTSAVTREQLAAILWRYAKYKGIDVSVGEDTNILSYDDAFDISEYAIPAMQWACGAGVVEGDGAKLTPEATATRAQAAVMFQRFCEKTAK